MLHCGWARDFASEGSFDERATPSGGEEPDGLDAFRSVRRRRRANRDERVGDGSSVRGGKR